MRLNTKFSEEWLEKATPFAMVHTLVCAMLFTVLGMRGVITRSLSIPYFERGELVLHWMKLRGASAMLASSAVLMMATTWYIAFCWRRISRRYSISPARLGAAIEWVTLLAILLFLLSFFVHAYINDFQL